MASIDNIDVVAAPVVPDKYDVIPIHASDRATFKACRRKWDWSSPARMNLTPRADVLGVYVPFMFGTGIHYALEHYYTPAPGISRDPVETFKTWYDIQWNGGVVTPDWLDLVYDLKPQPATTEGITGETPALYKVRGLREILPEGSDNYDEIEQLLELGVGMLENYKRYAAENDGFTPIMSEATFSVPVWDYANDCILTAIDMREQSPNYGKELEVHARGKRDMLYVKPNGKLGLYDHKTADTMEDPINLANRLDSDEQITQYLWATEVEAQYYDLPHKGQPIEEAIYQVLRKAVPRPPTVVRGGLFSVDRKNESTTIEMLQDWMQAAGISYMDLPEKHQGYYDWLREVGDEQFILRKIVRRNRHQLKNAGYRVYQESLDMLRIAQSSEDLIYPNLRRDWSCLNCVFRPPCLAKEAGEDWQYLIRENYSENRDR